MQVNTFDSRSVRVCVFFKSWLVIVFFVSVYNSAGFYFCFFTNVDINWLSEKLLSKSSSCLHIGALISSSRRFSLDIENSLALCSWMDSIDLIFYFSIQPANYGSFGLFQWLIGTVLALWASTDSPRMALFDLYGKSYLWIFDSFINGLKKTQRPSTWSLFRDWSIRKLGSFWFKSTYLSFWWSWLQLFPSSSGFLINWSSFQSRRFHFSQQMFEFGITYKVFVDFCI